MRIREEVGKKKRKKKRERRKTRFCLLHLPQQKDNVKKTMKTKARN